LSDRAANKKIDAKAAFLSALSALLAEGREATGPFATLSAQLADSPTAIAIQCWVYADDLRRLAALHGKMEG